MARLVVHLLLFSLIFLAACGDDQSQQNNRVGKSGEPYVLAISWQPAFCETAENKRECKSQTSTRFDASHFSLHGLWPQPGTNVYCGVSDKDRETDKRGRWQSLNVPRISNEIWKELQPIMPGTQSSLHKHEWIKHGTCAGVSIDQFFQKSVLFLDEINRSSLRDLFMRNINSELKARAVRNAVDQAFGNGAGERVKLSCRRDQNSGRNLIVEITLGLDNPFSDSRTLSQLILAAPGTDSGCPAGIVDEVGFQ